MVDRLVKRSLPNKKVYPKESKMRIEYYRRSKNSFKSFDIWIF